MQHSGQLSADKAMLLGLLKYLVADFVEHRDFLKKQRTDL